ncbi:MAG: hypothetical protein HUU22_12810 [Phycisphaerae bacterium]|nr:hypothetical protein [Phycisphaerae bacterium]
MLTANQTGSLGYLDADRTYAYDTLDRLLTARPTDTQNWTAAAVKTSWYQYDDLGNRISAVDRDKSAVGYAHDLQNRMTTHAGQTQNYDLAGRLTLTYSPSANASYQYEYDHLDRLTAVYDATGVTRKAAFTYDALGRRVEHVNDVLGRTTDYYFDGGLLPSP